MVITQRFLASLDRVLSDEGGRRLAMPPETDQLTNSGVTLVAFRQYLNKNAEPDDLRFATSQQIDEVYWGIWRKARCDMLPIGVDYVMFDMAVNPGPTMAAKALQRVLGVTEDGVLGPVTIQAARARYEVDMMVELTVARLRWYARRSSPTYIGGLLARSARTLGAGMGDYYTQE